VNDGPVLITGAAGFAGGHLAELLASTSPLVCWSREAPAPGLVPSAQWQQIDLLDREQVRGAVQAVRPARIYHLAGVPHVGGSWDATTPTLAGNVLATHYLFDALRRAGVRSELHVFDRGGHGFGMRGIAGKDAAAWPQLVQAWALADDSATH